MAPPPSLRVNTAFILVSIDFRLQFLSIGAISDFLFTEKIEGIHSNPQ